MIKFYSKGEQQYRFLSNFYPCQIVYEGKIWPSAEHAYQAKKYVPESMQEHVRLLPTAAATKRYARDNERMVRADWQKVKVLVMWDILYQKFTQHLELLAQLDATGQEKLVEDSPWDSFWGCGRDGKGKNQLGILLMELRAELRRPVGYQE